MSFCTKVQNKKICSCQETEPHKGITKIWIISNILLLAHWTLMKNLHSYPCTLSIYLFVFLLHLWFFKKNIFFPPAFFFPVACLNSQWPITCGTLVPPLAAGSVWGTFVVTFEILENGGNQLSVSVWVTVAPEKIIQPSGDEELLESKSVHELFLFSSFSI